MTAEPRFHVLLCSHNGARFIEAQIASILDQGPAIAAVHVHDFASSDGTRAVLERLETAAGGRLELTFHPEAPGALASFLTAMRQTAPTLPAGALVFFSDQDDIWLPEKLATIEAEIAGRGLSTDEPFLLFHDVRVVDEALQLLRPTYYTGNPFRLPRDLTPSRVLMANPAIGHTMLMSLPLLRLVAEWPDGRRYLMHDWLALLIASRLARVEHIATPLSLYRQHGGNVLGAYKARRRLVSVARLLRFMDGMIIQAVSFSRAIERVPGRRPGTRSALERWCRRGYRSAALGLAAGAVTHGPTWQRKAIGALLLARAIIGPAPDGWGRELR